MKINTQNQSRFLSRHDLDTPIVVTMDRVTEDATLRNPQILHFAPAHRLKPFPMNVTNRRILVAAYGDDPTAWHGRPVELYFNPSIPNPRNPAQPGGICVRIPTGNGNGNGTRPAAVPASPKPVPGPAPAVFHNGAGPTTKATAEPLAAEIARALEGFRRADTTENLDRWWRWADSLPFDDEARAELSSAYVAAQERIAVASAPARRPAPARA